MGSETLPAMTDYAIVAERLAKRYPNGTEAVRGISFRVRPGEIFGILGPNGAGKSTTMGMLGTLVRPTGGHATVAGFDVVGGRARSAGGSGSRCRRSASTSSPPAASCSSCTAGCTACRAARRQRAPACCSSWSTSTRRRAGAWASTRAG